MNARGCNSVRSMALGAQISSDFVANFPIQLSVKYYRQVIIKTIRGGCLFWPGIRGWKAGRKPAVAIPTGDRRDTAGRKRERKCSGYPAIVSPRHKTSACSGTY